MIKNSCEGIRVNKGELSRALAVISFAHLLIDPKQF